MPGEEDILNDFTATLRPKVLGQIVAVIFDKMKLAGEAGSLLKIEEEINAAIAKAKRQWQAEFERAKDKRGQDLLFSKAEMLRLSKRPEQVSLFDVSDVTDEQFWEQAEDLILQALRAFAEQAENGSGYRRRLFAEDAARGFAFIDICRKRFDVVLMNPRSESLQQVPRNTYSPYIVITNLISTLHSLSEDQIYLKTAGRLEQ